MKSLCIESEGHAHVEIHFSVEIPEFPAAHLPGDDEDYGVIRLTVDRSTDFQQAGKRMAKHNAGRLGVEYDQPADLYGSFLRSLALLEGVVQINGARRYSISVETGLCFEAKQVAQSIANCVRDHLYPDQSLECDHIQRPAPAAFNEDPPF